MLELIRIVGGVRVEPQHLTNDVKSHLRTLYAQ